MTDTSETIAAIAEREGLTLSSAFVPFSQSRNAKPGLDGKVWKSLNWRVTLWRHGREVLTTDYSKGEGHCPAIKDKRWIGNKHLMRRALDLQIETGKQLSKSVFDQEPRVIDKPLTGPSIIEVVASLALDSDVIDYATFEDWAHEFGYDPDSRSGERIYRACLEICLKLRASLGDSVLEELREAALEY